MFLHVLGKQEKSAFFDLAQQMIVADGMVAEPEAAYLDRLYFEVGMAGKAALGDVEAEVDLSIFESRKARLAVAVELTIISIVDGEYHPNEAAFANAIVTQFGITPDEHAALCRVAENAAQALVDMRNLMD